MKHLGDITKINGAEIEPVDCITGGSPCQDLSVAGKRAGLAGERSGLFMEQIRIVKEMREHDRRIKRADNDFRLRPRYMVWENVPGAFSSNKGQDFQAVLTEIVRIVRTDAPDVPLPDRGGWSKSGCIMGYGSTGCPFSIAWRLHDAQFWGVPQRRKRIALVADFGGVSAPEILFERQSMSGDTEESGKERERVARDAEESADVTSWGFEPGAAKRLNPETRFNEELSPTLRSEMGDNQVAVVYGMSSFDSNAMKSSNPHSGIYEAETSRTLDLNGGNPACNQGGMMVVQSAGFDGNMGAKAGNIGYEEEKAPTLNAGKPMHCVCLNDQGGSSMNVSYEVAGVLRAQEHGHQPIVLEGNGSRPSHRGDGYAESETMYTLNSTEHHAVCVENHPADSRVKISDDGIVQTLSGRMGTGGGNVPMVMEPVCIGNWQANQSVDTVVGALNTMHDQQAVMVAAVDCRNGTENNDINGTLQDKEQGQNLNSNNVCRVGDIVRRLTPLECERLQGFPDGWTDIGDWVDSKGKKHKESDSPRYKALGNSIAVGYANNGSGFWMWLLKRISAQYERNATLGSLFDGIGGFPLAWEHFNGKGSARWASEIEEFPIAVTKKHFPED